MTPLNQTSPNLQAALTESQPFLLASKEEAPPPAVARTRKKTEATSQTTKAKRKIKSCENGGRNSSQYNRLEKNLNKKQMDYNAIARKLHRLKISNPANWRQISTLRDSLLTLKDEITELKKLLEPLATTSETTPKNCVPQETAAEKKVREERRAELRRIILQISKEQADKEKKRVQDEVKKPSSHTLKLTTNEKITLAKEQATHATQKVIKATPEWSLYKKEVFFKLFGYYLSKQFPNNKKFVSEYYQKNTMIDVWLTYGAKMARMGVNMEQVFIQTAAKLSHGWKPKPSSATNLKNHTPTQNANAKPWWKMDRDSFMKLIRDRDITKQTPNSMQVIKKPSGPGAPSWKTILPKAVESAVKQSVRR